MSQFGKLVCSLATLLVLAGAATVRRLARERGRVVPGRPGEGRRRRGRADGARGRSAPTPRRA